MPYKSIFKRIEYEKEYRARNAKKLKSRSQSHYIKNKNAYKLRAQLQRLANPERKRENDRLYYQRKKEIIKKRLRDNYRQNPEKYKKRVRLRAVKCPQLKKESDRKSYQKHRLKILEQRKVYWIKNRPTLLLKQKLWREKNPDKIKASYAAYIKTHPEAKVCMNLRIRLNKILGNRAPRNLTVFNLVGCSLPTLRRHIENQFSGDMSWTNRGKLWHVDHIIPISLYENKNDANHYSNLRPMLANLNISRGNRINGHFVFRGKQLVEHAA